MQKCSSVLRSLVKFRGFILVQKSKMHLWSRLELKS